MGSWDRINNPSYVGCRPSAALYCRRFYNACSDCVPAVPACVAGGLPTLCPGRGLTEGPTVVTSRCGRLFAVSRCGCWQGGCSLPRGPTGHAVKLRPDRIVGVNSRFGPLGTRLNSGKMECPLPRGPLGTRLNSGKNGCSLPRGPLGHAVKLRQDGCPLPRGPLGTRLNSGGGIIESQRSADLPKRRQPRRIPWLALRRD